MTVRDEDWSAYVDRMDDLHDLRLDGPRRAEVIVQLERIAAMAEQLGDFPLDAHIDPAPVFRP